IFNDASASATLTGSTVGHNEAFSGGGIYTSLQASTVLHDVTIEGNWAYVDGGGLYNEDRSTLELIDSTVRGNRADGIHGGAGGGGIAYGLYGVPSRMGSVSLLRSTVSDNEALYGGGILAVNGRLELTNSTVSGNRADMDGGGLYLASISAEIFSATIAGNL